MARNQEWRDRELMGLGEYYQGPIPGLRFVVPKALAPESRGGDDTKAPGIYLIEGKSNKSPHIRPEHSERLLDRAEAIEYAQAVDRIASPRPAQLPKDDGDPFFPPTYAALVEAFYECLGRKLGDALDQLRERETTLRETRAALTGAVSS